MSSITTTIHTINAVTATTTGEPIDVRSAQRISIFGKRSAHSSGSTAWSVEISPNYGIEGETAVWVAYNKLINNAANTNAQTLLRTASVSLGADGSVFFSMDLESGGDNFTHMRVTATETTDGTHDAWVVLTSTT